MDLSRLVEESAVKIGAIRPNEKVLVMLSGGADSVCLLHLLAGKMPVAKVAALHVNYDLREESDEDEAFCRRLCGQLGVGFFCERVEVPSTGNIQATARDQRYRLAESIRSNEGMDLIAVGHTLSDQAETVIYRLASSPGRRSLLGMRSREGRLVRPLLGVTREEVRAYCEAEDLSWREDSSNEDLSYARNRIRANVMPELRRINEMVEKNIVATRDALYDESTVLDELVRGAMENIGAGSRPPSVDGERLRELPVALQRLVVRELVQNAAAEGFPLSAQRADEVIELSGRSGSSGIDLGPVRAVSEYGILRFFKAETESTPQEEAILSVPGSCTFGDWEVTIEVLSIVPVELQGGLDTAMLDAERLGGEITVRSWREGDRIKPLGMEGTKSLQDLFTDSKVPQSLRRQLPVVDVDGTVAWVAGVAISDEFKITDKTKRAVKLGARLIDAH